MELIWTLPIDAGVIDTAISSSRKIIVAGDVSGRVCVVNYAGKLLADLSYDLPVWGVDISSDAKTIAIGMASKSPSRGRFIVLTGDVNYSPVVDRSVPSEVWDVAIAPATGYIFASTWNDGLLTYNINSGVVGSVLVAANFFGISIATTNHNEVIYVTASGQGLYTATTDNLSDLHQLCQSTYACYNNCVATDKIYFGSARNILSEFRLADETVRDYVILMDQVSAIASSANLIFLGDLGGNFAVSLKSHPNAPYFRKRFPGAIWNLSIDEKASLLFVGCGDGHVYAFDIRNVLAGPSYNPNEKISFDPNVLSGVKVFLSYASENIEQVRIIFNYLQTIGCSPWLDKINLLPGQDWKHEINKAIRTTDFCVLCLSSTSVSKRGFVQKELRQALELLDELPEGQVFALPVRLDVCTIPSSLLAKQWVDFFADDGLYKIAMSIYLETLRKQSK